MSNKHTAELPSDPLWGHNQPRTGHAPSEKCCPGCAGALAARKANGIKPKRGKHWYNELRKV